jgi:zinc protease
MGFLKDVQDMPNQYDYSIKFFDRYYRPEYATIIVTGDVDAKTARAQVEKAFGDWQKGSYHADVPVEPKQQGPREAHIDWPSPTLPLLTIAYKGPAYTDTAKDTAALDAFSTLVFGPNSELYQKLVVKEQKLDSLFAEAPASVDPDLFEIRADLKHIEDLPEIRAEILATVKRFQDELIPADKLEAVKKRERYSFTMRLDNSESVAQTVGAYVALRRTPDTIDKLFAQTAQLTPEDLREMARKYLIESGRTIVTLTGTPAGAGK